MRGLGRPIVRRDAHAEAQPARRQRGGELDVAMSELVHSYDSHGRQYDADGKLLSQHIFECPSPFYSSEWATAEEPKDKEEPKKEEDRKRKYATLTHSDDTNQRCHSP